MFNRSSFPVTICEFAFSSGDGLPRMVISESSALWVLRNCVVCLWTGLCSISDITDSSSEAVLCKPRGAGDVDRTRGWTGGGGNVKIRGGCVLTSKAK